MSADFVQMALDAGQLEESGAQWSCSSRCWQEDGPHDETCRSIVFFVRTPITPISSTKDLA